MRRDLVRVRILGIIVTVLPAAARRHVGCLSANLDFDFPNGYL
jgi:hypothetical protein